MRALEAAAVDYLWQRSHLSCDAWEIAGFFKAYETNLSTRNDNSVIRRNIVIVHEYLASSHIWMRNCTRD